MTCHPASLQVCRGHQALAHKHAAPLVSRGREQKLTRACRALMKVRRSFLLPNLLFTCTMHTASYMHHSWLVKQPMSTIGTITKYPDEPEYCHKPCMPLSVASAGSCMCCSHYWLEATKTCLTSWPGVAADHEAEGSKKTFSHTTACTCSVSKLHAAARHLCRVLHAK